MNILNGNNHKIIRTNVVENLGVEDLLRSNGFFTSITIKDGKSGKVLYSGHNTTVLGGRLAMLEELFGITKNKDQHLLLNDMMGISHSETDTVIASNTIKRSCSYFIVGSGAASSEVIGKYYTPKNYETKLYNPIPFRFAPLADDLSSAEQEQDRLRKVVANGTSYVAYYAKKFNAGSVILEYNSSSYKPIESHTVPVDENDSTHPLRGGSVLAYINFSVSIDETELKEYFQVTEGNTTNCAMSEVGLVYGYDTPNSNDSSRNELAAAELLCKITSASTSLADEGSSRVLTYKTRAK